MVNRWRGLVVLLVLLSGQMTAPARGDENLLWNAGRQAPAGAVPQEWARPEAAGQPPQTASGGGYAPMAPNMVPQPQPWPPAAPGNVPLPVAGPPQGPPPNWQGPAQFPPVQPGVPGNFQNPQAPFAGGFPVQDPRGMSVPSMMGGAVDGRLLNQGRPLVNCHVVIVPMHDAEDPHRVDERKALTTLTDEQGVFHFEGVPAGQYKLTWLPQGQTQWIRRISMRPDVKVQSGETTRLKEIRVALQTIN
jgi:hypothetical protein